MNIDNSSDFTLQSEMLSLSQEMTARPTGVTPQLHRLDEIRVLVFDVYGTLFTSGSGDVGTAQTQSKAEALISTFDRMGYRLHKPGDAQRVMDGYFAAIQSAHVERRAEGITYPEVDILEIWIKVLEQFRAAFAERPQPIDLKRLAVVFECYSNPVWPMPGLADVLGHFKQTGIPMTIVSNAQFYTPLLFPAFLGSELGVLGFRQPLCTWSYEMLEGKPSEALYTDQLAKLKYAGLIDHAGQALFVGNDMLNDLTPSAACGMRTALFSGDDRSLRMRTDDERCEGTHPDVTITELAQLKEVVAL